MKKFFETLIPCLFIGLGFAGMLAYWNNQGILIDEFITATLTIGDLQIGVVIVWVFIGVILGIGRR